MPPRCLVMPAAVDEQVQVQLPFHVPELPPHANSRSPYRSPLQISLPGLARRVEEIATPQRVRPSEDRNGAGPLMVGAGCHSSYTPLSQYLARQFGVAHWFLAANSALASLSAGH